MSLSKVFIAWENQPMPTADADALLVSVTEFKLWFTKGDILKHLFRYKESILYTYRYDLINKPFGKSLAVALMSPGNSFIKDQHGQTIRITIPLLIKLFFEQIKVSGINACILYKEKRDIHALLNSPERDPSPPPLDLSARPVYLRTDFCFGLSAGGSVAHTAGVLNNLSKFCGDPIYLTPYILPAIKKEIEKREISPNLKLRSFRDLMLLQYNQVLYGKSLPLLKNERLSFIYQRFCMHSYSGILLSNHFNVPFVLEYNGSDVWINNYWYTPVKNESLWKMIEILNLKKADLIVVVSKVLREQLVEQNIEPDKILVNPNGVDTDNYRPSIDSSSIKIRFGLQDKLVFGFIGTFGIWHGIEILAESFGKLIKIRPELKNQVRLLMIGDGLIMPKVKSILKRYGLVEEAIFTGIVPQEEGPKYLAACDFLVSPYIPNSDGSPFFLSPTKLFEYMAMGKGIIASDLDQIGEILTHEKNALMVKPGDPDSLMKAMIRLIQNPELGRKLGQSAREEAVKNYTWKEHTRKIIHKLKERCQYP